MLKNAQKLTKTFKNSHKPSKTVPKFVSRISYLVSRRSDLKKQTQCAGLRPEIRNPKHEIRNHEKQSQF